MREERLAVLSRRLQRLEASCGFVADRYHLERDDVDIATRCRTEVVSDAQALASFLTREVESRELLERSVERIRLRVVHDEVVPRALRGEVAVYRARLQPVLACCLLLEPDERRLELFLHDLVE